METSKIVIRTEIYLVYESYILFSERLKINKIVEPFLNELPELPEDMFEPLL